MWICAPITLVATILVGFRQHEDMYRAFRHSMAFLPWAPWIDGSYWTLGIEISFYAAVLLVIKFFRFERIKVLAVVVGIFSSLFVVFRANSGLDEIRAFAPQLTWALEGRLPQLLLMEHGIFFALGVFLWSELIKKHDTKNVFWIILFCITGCAQIAAASNYSAATPCIIWLASIALIVVSVHANSSLHALPVSIVKAIQIAGMMTYPLYLVHQMVGAAMMGWMVANGVDRWVALATATIIIFVLSWTIALRAEPWLQGWTKYLVDEVHDRYRTLLVRFAK